MRAPSSIIAPIRMFPTAKQIVYLAGHRLSRFTSLLCLVRADSTFPEVSTNIVAGARFWLRYSIVEAAAAISPWYYFKLSMNGRLITSWGANSTTKPSGQVMRGLFDPSERWNYKDYGTVYKNNGTEARPFFFAKEDTERSAAEDGGLIEVLVYRARGRRRRMPNPEEFKSQDRWGIV